MSLLVTAAEMRALDRETIVSAGVVGVDVPSGLDADRGIIGPCARADHTVTFAFAKIGLVGADEQAVVGALHVVDIGIPEKLARERGVKAELLEDAVLAPLRARPS